jgi:hypothetical protein
MHMVVILVTVLAVAACIEMGVFPSPFCRLLVRIDSRGLSIERGSLPPRAREFLSDAIRSARIDRGFIAVSGANRVRFSREIPEECRQQIRNILLNR